MTLFPTIVTLYHNKTDVYHILKGLKELCSSLHFTFPCMKYCMVKKEFLT